MKVKIKILANGDEIFKVNEENRINDANWIKEFEKDNTIGPFVPKEAPDRVIEERDMYLDESGIEQAYEHESGMIAMFYKGRELFAIKTDKLMQELEKRFK